MSGPHLFHPTLVRHILEHFFTSHWKEKCIWFINCSLWISLVIDSSWCHVNCLTPLQTMHADWKCQSLILNPWLLVCSHSPCITTCLWLAKPGANSNLVTRCQHNQLSTPVSLDRLTVLRCFVQIVLTFCHLIFVDMATCQQRALLMFNSAWFVLSAKFFLSDWSEIFPHCVYWSGRRDNDEF